MEIKIISGARAGGSAKAKQIGGCSAMLEGTRSNKIITQLVGSWGRKPGTGNNSKKEIFRHGKFSAFIPCAPTILYTLPHELDPECTQCETFHKMTLWQAASGSVAAALWRASLPLCQWEQANFSTGLENILRGKRSSHVNMIVEVKVGKNAWLKPA